MRARHNTASTHRSSRVQDLHHVMHVIDLHVLPVAVLHCWVVLHLCQHSNRQRRDKENTTIIRNYPPRLPSASHTPTSNHSLVGQDERRSSGATPPDTQTQEEIPSERSGTTGATQQIHRTPSFPHSGVILYLFHEGALKESDGNGALPHAILPEADHLVLRHYAVSLEHRCKLVVPAPSSLPLTLVSLSLSVCLAGAISRNTTNKIR